MGRVENVDGMKLIKREKPEKISKTQALPTTIITLTTWKVELEAPVGTDDRFNHSCAEAASPLVYFNLE